MTNPGVPTTATDDVIVHSGLAGIVSHRSSISSIIGATLTYRGIDIGELAREGTFEEIVHLLWHGRLPRRNELEALRRELVHEFRLPPAAVAVLRQVPQNAEPMRVLQATMAVLGMVDPDRDDNSPAANERKAVRITSQLSAVTCGFHRVRSGKELLEPSEKLGFAANYFLLLNGREPQDVEEQALDQALILHADHELNASTFAARVTASTLADMHSALAAAIGTLKGPLHGGANRAVMEALQEIGAVEQVEAWLAGKLERGEKIMGFGHAVYKEGDPRARLLREMSRRLGELTRQEHWYAISERLEALVKERKRILPNVDFYSASTYYCLGLPPDLYTPIFACSRVAGWIAHLREQYADNALIRPRALYTGPKDGRWVPVDDR